MQVGYKLVEIATGNVLQAWGGNWGQLPNPPNPIHLPNGDQVCGAQAGDEFQGYRLDPWSIESAPALSIEEKLAKVDLTINDLKAALGLSS